MPVLLADAKKFAQDDIQKGVIDEFRKQSLIMDKMIFDDAVTPGTAGATLTYGYNRVSTQPSAGFRALNSEYTPQESVVTPVSVTLKVFGGSFEIDRVLAKVGGLADNVAFQLEQKIKATRAVFHDTFINGDIGSDANAFDGINKAITGSSTEYNAAAYIDLSSAANVDSNYKQVVDQLDEFLALLDGKPDFLGGNIKLINKIKACLRRAGQISVMELATGQQVESYLNIPLLDMGEKAGSTNPVCALATRTISGSVTGLADLFAARLGLDGVHGVSLAGQPLVNTILPDFKTPGAVKKGEVEMVAAVAMKATKSAGVFRNLKVQ